jgi:hypothetical protein
MSRELPLRPNLEYLKKQAKELLSELRQRKPDAQLSDAQHTLAREYGLSSWPALHAHVTSVVGDEAPRPLIGTWVWEANGAVDVDSPSRVMLSIDVSGDAVTITDVTVDGSGRQQRTVNTIHADGREHAFPHGYALTSRWLSSHALEAVGKKDGHVEGRVRYEVSGDGSSLTLTTADRLLRLERL